MHVDVPIQLFRHVDMEKNMPTTALASTKFFENGYPKIFFGVRVGLINKQNKTKTKNAHI